MVRSTFVVTWLALASIAFPQEKERPRDQWLSRPVDDRTFQTYLEFFRIDSSLPFDTELQKTETEEGIAVEHLSFQSTPQERVTAHFYRAAVRDEERRPALIQLHGGGAGGKNRRFIRRVAFQYVRSGWNVLAIDFKHWGDRADGLLTSYTEKDKHDNLYNQPSLYLDWIIQNVRDIRRSYDFLVQERQADPDRISLIGASRGAVVGFIATAVETRLAGAVFVLGGHFDALEREHSPAACPANYIGRIHPRPILTVNGRNDNDFDREASVLPLFQHAGDSHEQIWTDGGHGYIGDEHRAAMLEWMRENLQ